MTNDTVRKLNTTAYAMRKLALRGIQAANSGHIGGSFSMAEILSVLYFKQLNIRPDEPGWAERDRFVLSKGHCTPITYAALAMKGFFPANDYMHLFRRVDGYLSGHMEMRHVPGVDMSTGSLGQGLSVGVGIALAGKLDEKDYTVYVVLGDGEIQEGQNWEAAMAASHYRLDNLIAIVDQNQLQLDGFVCEIMNTAPLDQKFAAFGWHVQTLNGHDVEALDEAIENAKAVQGKPSVILAQTVKGKGVSVFENQVRFHGGRPNASEYEPAFRELDGKIAEWSV